MKIQRTPLKNRTIINHSKLRLNPKIIKKFSSSKKVIKRNNKIDKLLKTLDNRKLNFIYMALNETTKSNNIENKNIKKININNDIPSFPNKNIKKRNKNKSCILQNIFLAKILNMEFMDNMKKNDLETNISNNSIIKKVNMNNYFLDNYNIYNQKPDYDIKNNNKIEKYYNSIENKKRSKNIFSLMRIKSNMKFIKQYPYFKDLNLRPSSEKSWLFTYEKKNSKSTSNKDKYFDNNKNNKRIIPKIHFIKNINNSNLEYKSKNFINNFIINDYNERNINNSHNQNKICNNNNLYQARIKKNYNIIFGYNAHSRNYENFSDKSQTIFKKSKLAKTNYENNFIKKKTIKRNTNKSKNNIFRMKSCKNQNNIYKSIINNRKIYLKNNNEKKNNMDNDILNEDLIMNNSSFSDIANEREDFTFLNSIYS